jgi:hypothetical protein
MLGFFFVGFYIERRCGSVYTLSLLTLISGLCAFMEMGQSVIWFFMIGYVVINYLFSLKKSDRSKTNTIVGAIIVALEYFRCCFYDKTGGGIGITFYPYQIIHNTGHCTGFFMGILVALFFEISHIVMMSKCKLNVEALKKKGKTGVAEKILYVVASLLIICSIGLSVYNVVKVQDRKTYIIEIVWTSYNVEYRDSVEYALGSDIYECLRQWEERKFGTELPWSGYYSNAEHTECNIVKYTNRQFVPLFKENKFVVYAILSVPE